MSEWITDRPPTEEDADSEKCVWTMCAGKVVPWGYEGIREGWPWMRTNRPEPYVKPKRWKVAYDKWHKCWTVFDIRHMTPLKLNEDTDAHREAAERIAAVYEEVMP